MKNILFYYTSEISPSAGGVQRVVSLQYHELSKKGYKIYSIFGKKRDFDNAIPQQYQLPSPNYLDSQENIDYIQDFLEQKHINLAINFAAIMSKSSLCVVKACKNANVPLISVLHNTLQSILWKIPFIKLLMNYNVLREAFCNILKLVHRFPLYKGGLFLYNNTVATVVLAPCYITEYRKMITKNASNIYSIYNPLSIPSTNDINWEQKQSIVLFVGRLEQQKGIDKLIRIWKKIDEPSWKLCIVGSGSQEKKLKDLANSLGISSSILFEGHKSPIPYYEKAKLFCLTSIYEGYPMTLIECQAYGVVPIIYDTFSASHDIITSGKNGMVIPAFDESSYIKMLRNLMHSDDLLRQMSSNCKEKSKKYSVDNIIEQWVSIIEKYSR